MREKTGSSRSGVELVVAVFDDWASLHAVLIELETVATVRPAAVLHARSDIPITASEVGLLKQMTKLRFEPSRQDIACTVGWLAGELSERLARGARSLADALHDWLGFERARQLQGHVEKGHFVLCVELRTSEDFSVICGSLVRASPHMVELCNVQHEP